MGFGEEAVQSLPGKIGSQVLVCSLSVFFPLKKISSFLFFFCLFFPFEWSFHIKCNSSFFIIILLSGTLQCSSCYLQDVNDVLAAIDHVIEKGLADPSKIAVLGGSHGGFLTTHLIGQV